MSRAAKSVTTYHLEAGIAAVHCTAKTYADTDWAAIVNYYCKLGSLKESPVIKLDFAIALSKLKGPRDGLKALNESNLQKPLEQHALFYAAKADMHFRMSDYLKAKMYYQLAMDLAKTKSDKYFIRSKIQECDLNNISHY